MSSAASSSPVATRPKVAAKSMPKNAVSAKHENAGSDGKQKKAGTDGKNDETAAKQIRGDNEEAGTDGDNEEVEGFVPRVRTCRIWDLERALRTDDLILHCNHDKYWKCREVAFDQQALDPYQRPIVLIDGNESAAPLLPRSSPGEDPDGREVQPRVASASPPFDGDDLPPLKRLR